MKTSHGMRTILASLAAVLVLASATTLISQGCGGGSGGGTATAPAAPEETVQKTEITGLSYAPSASGGFTIVRGTVRNLTSRALTVLSVYSRAYTTGDKVLDDAVDFIGDLAAGATAPFEMSVRTNYMKVTRWEHWTEDYEDIAGE